MAFTVDWVTKVITIPKADTALVSAGPPEIREYDASAFWLEARKAEASQDGMPFDVIVRRVGAVTLAGVTYAPFVEIINGYTITFEDGNYRVNVFGANHNFFDVVNPNSVGIASNNSAGSTTPFLDQDQTEQLRYQLGLDGAQQPTTQTPGIVDDILNEDLANHPSAAVDDTVGETLDRAATKAGQAAAISAAK